VLRLQTGIFDTVPLGPPPPSLRSPRSAGQAG